MVQSKASPAEHPGVDKILEQVKERVNACIQCGTCSASCPNAGFMDLTPRRMWRMVAADEAAALFESMSFCLCSSCYYCTLRCPRGLALTRAMAELKQAAALMESPRYRSSELFYRLFVDNIRRYGRIREMELMGRYFWGLKNPALPIRYAPLGLALLRRKKITPELPGQGPGKLSALFAAVKEESVP